MHIGGVLLFEGPPPAFEDYLDHVRSRLHLVPRYRQKLATPPLETGRPLWVDDPTFNLEYHVRHTALPAPGSEEQLFLLASRIASQQLDRSKPLWENWLVEGLDDGRFAIIFKTHHSLVDGISGRRPRRRSCSTSSAEPAPPADRARAVAARSRSRPAPSWSLAGVRGVVTHQRRAGHPGGRRRDSAPRPSLGALRDAAEGLGEIVWAGLNPAPETPLNVADRPAPPLRRRPPAAGGLQGGQGRPRRHRQRRRADGRLRRARRLAALARGPHRGPGDARAGPGLGPHQGRAPHARQPARP